MSEVICDASGDGEQSSMPGNRLSQGWRKGSRKRSVEGGKDRRLSVMLVLVALCAYYVGTSGR